jgi:hypothetical protein
MAISYSENDGRVAISYPLGAGYDFQPAQELCPHLWSGDLRDTEFYRAFFKLIEEAVKHSGLLRRDFRKHQKYSWGLVYKALRCSTCATEFVVEIRSSTI